MTYKAKNIGYPRSNKYKILDEYIETNDIIKLSEMPEFANKIKSLHSACLRLNICLKRIDNYTYKKLGSGYWKKDYIYEFKRRKKVIGENFSNDIGY